MQDRGGTRGGSTWARTECMGYFAEHFFFISACAACCPRRGTHIHTYTHTHSLTHSAIFHTLPHPHLGSGPLIGQHTSGGPERSRDQVASSPTGYHMTRPIGFFLPSGSFPSQQASTDRALFSTRKVVLVPTLAANFFSPCGPEKVFSCTATGRLRDTAPGRL